MMDISDDTLMAFADGELDAAERARLDAALATDAALRERVAAIRRQRERVAAAFAGVLDEPVPQRLAGLLQAAAAPVVDLADARERRDRARRLPTWAQWGGMAASLVLGVLVGTQIDRGGAEFALEPSAGRMVAAGAVGRALSTQLASEPAVGAGVSVQLSFVDKSGDYCRTFSTAAIAGLACRQQGRWTVQSLAAAGPTPAGPVRQAASALPKEVLEAVDRRIAGDTLDAERERRARDRSWQP